MKLAHKLIITSLALAITAPVLAADSTDVMVSGRLVPAACTPTLSNGGAADYGTLGMGELLDDNYAVLPEKTVDLTIVCDGPAKVQLQALNQRLRTAVSNKNDDTSTTDYARTPTGVTLFGAKDWGVAGLGLNNGTERIGAFTARVQPGSIVVDGQPGQFIFRKYSTGNWDTDSYGQMFSSYRYVSWRTDTAVSGPGAFTNMSAKIDVQAYLNKASALTQTQDIHLDGLVTLNMIYL